MHSKSTVRKRLLTIWCGNVAGCCSTAGRCGPVSLLPWRGTCFGTLATKDSQQLTNTP